MRVSTVVRHPSLFSYEADTLTVASARNSVGEFFEIITAEMVKGHRLVTDHRKDICPDIVNDDGEYFESKSIGKTNASIVYESRLCKDYDFVRLGNKLTYVLWKHRSTIHDGMTRESLYDALTATLEYVVLVPFDQYRDISLTGPLMMLNPKNTNRGYGSYGYTQGFRTHLKKFTAVASEEAGFQIEVLDRTITVPTVYRVDNS